VQRVNGIGVRCERVDLELGGRRVLSNVQLEVEPGAHCLVLGANGAGKTQLLQLLAGERWPTPNGRERLRYSDARGRELELRALKRRVAMVGGERQDKYLRHDWNFSVARVIGSGCHGSDRPLAALARAERRRVRTLLARFGLARLRRRRFLTLSYGERRLTLIARALASRPGLAGKWISGAIGQQQGCRAGARLLSRWHPIAVLVLARIHYTVATYRTRRPRLPSHARVKSSNVGVPEWHFLASTHSGS